MNDWRRKHSLTCHSVWKVGNSWTVATLALASISAIYEACLARAHLILPSLSLDTKQTALGIGQRKVLLTQLEDCLRAKCEASVNNWSVKHPTCSCFFHEMSRKSPSAERRYSWFSDLGIVRMLHVHNVSIDHNSKSNCPILIWFAPLDSGWNCLLGSIKI